MKTITQLNNQQRLRQGIKYRFIRWVWIWSRNLSTWAGKVLISWSVDADEKDSGGA